MRIVRELGLLSRRKMLETLRQPVWVIVGLSTPLLYLALFAPLLHRLAGGPGFPRGAVLDVYVGEFEHLPPARLWSDLKVLITPHVSGASDEDRHGAIDLFCDNLRAYLDGRPLRNVIDWERGY